MFKKEALLEIYLKNFFRSTLIGKLQNHKKI